MDRLLGNFVIGIIIFIGVFLLLRSFWCWYWKINARLDEQEKTNELLQAILIKLGGKVPTVREKVVKKVKCQKCGQLVEPGSYFEVSEADGRIIKLCDECYNKWFDNIVQEENNQV